MSSTVVKHVTAGACCVAMLVTAAQAGNVQSLPCGYDGNRDACSEEGETQGQKALLQARGSLDSMKTEEDHRISKQVSEIELRELAASSQLPQFTSRGASAWKPATANVQGICDAVREEAEQRLRKMRRLVGLPKFEALGYSVAHASGEKGGTKYLVKVDVGEGVLALLRIVDQGDSPRLARAELFRTQ
eukprot:CAMPEP_0172659650 /NCGR_PEP_ID=MMETSP1074-20121228/3581_1 /TAXON_ID=2916 /ORGANISM="Ceratium fusus, Strain PA161109" /LENGTH=188 /DNA_ID=CAMNT_0013475171 /DNA_START=63 /DNA_END=629 /DNA_ORIENTATION=-